MDFNMASTRYYRMFDLPFDFYAIKNGIYIISVLRVIVFNIKCSHFLFSI